MTILVDEAYEEANRRSANWAGEMVRRRFAEVYGARGEQVLTEIQSRMESNIRSDGRSDPQATDKPSQD
ncbi:hypothetical protein ACVWWO_006438 [Bradyrhizobium sp. F1.13.1]